MALHGSSAYTRSRRLPGDDRVLTACAQRMASEAKQMWSCGLLHGIPARCRAWLKTLALHRIERGLRQAKDEDDSAAIAIWIARGKGKALGAFLTRALEDLFLIRHDKNGKALHSATAAPSAAEVFLADSVIQAKMLRLKNQLWRGKMCKSLPLGFDDPGFDEAVILQQCVSTVHLDAKHIGSAKSALTTLRKRKADPPDLIKAPLYIRDFKHFAACMKTGGPERSVGFLFAILEDQEALMATFPAPLLRHLKASYSATSDVADLKESELPKGSNNEEEDEEEEKEAEAHFGEEEEEEEEEGEEDGISAIAAAFESEEAEGALLFPPSVAASRMDASVRAAWEAFKRDQPYAWRKGYMPKLFSPLPVTSMKRHFAIFSTAALRDILGVAEHTPIFGPGMRSLTLQRLLNLDSLDLKEGEELGGEILSDGYSIRVGLTRAKRPWQQRRGGGWGGSSCSSIQGSPSRTDSARLRLRRGRVTRRPLRALRLSSFSSRRSCPASPGGLRAILASMPSLPPRSACRMAPLCGMRSRSASFGRKHTSCSAPHVLMRF